MVTTAFWTVAAAIVDTAALYFLNNRQVFGIGFGLAVAGLGAICTAVAFVNIVRMIRRN